MSDGLKPCPYCGGPMELVRNLESNELLGYAHCITDFCESDGPLLTWHGKPAGYRLSPEFEAAIVAATNKRTS